MSTIKHDLPQAAVGVAYNGYVPSFIDHFPGLIDYVEVPFELLRHNPQVSEICSRIPVILHCASLSVGGAVQCPKKTRQEILGWLDRTNSPWIGEHLAFITAHGDGSFVPGQDTGKSEEHYNIGYTVSPPMNKAVLERTVNNLDTYREDFPVGLLLENSPLYFSIPTTTMSQAEFFQELCARTEVGMLLDLSHLYISSQNMKFDPFKELEKFPLDRVVEIHISGVDAQSDGYWDNHAQPAPDIIYQMLECVLNFVSPRAVTLEYNWSLRFPTTLLVDELSKVRETLGKAPGRKRVSV